MTQTKLQAAPDLKYESTENLYGDMNDRGYAPKDIVWDGNIHRFDIDKKNDRAGWYVAFRGEISGAAHGNWKTGEKYTWCSIKKNTMTDAQRADYLQEIEEAHKLHKAEKRRHNEAIANKSVQMWNKSSPAISHKYLKQKNVKSHGLRVRSDGVLLVPMYDAGGKLWNVQRIDPEQRSKSDRKKGLYQGRTEGVSFTIQGNEKIYICEGYATGASIYEATGGTTIIAFSAGNLKPVAQGIRVKHPEAGIIICADDDRWTKGNPGITKATEAAAAVGARVIKPEFKDLSTKPTDYNDLAAIEGLEAVKKQIEASRQAVKPLTGNEIIYQQIIDEYNEKYAIMMLGGKFRVMKHTIDPLTNQPDISFSTRADFMNFNLSDTIIIKVENGKGELKEQKINRAGNWLADKRATKYEGLIFDPSKEVVSGYYNLWRGFAVKPKQGSWTLFQRHIEDNIAADNPGRAKWILAWLARIVQEPGGKRPGTSIVMRGKQGTGKGVFAEQFGKLLGNHFVQLSQPGQVTGQFNMHLKAAICVFVDEGFWGGDKKAEGVIKAMITEDRLAIEGKGQDIVQVKNNINMLIASNNEWVVPAGLEERRFFVIEVSDNKQQDHGYFKAIVDQMDNGGREAMMHDLLNMDIAGVNLRTFERTEALFDQILSGMTTVQKYWFNRLNDGTTSLAHEEWKGRVSSKAQHSEYVEFANTIGDHYRKCPRQFGLELNKLCKKIHMKKARLPGGEREQVRYFPSLEECRAEFEAMVNMEVPWDSIT